MKHYAIYLSVLLLFVAIACDKEENLVSSEDDRVAVYLPDPAAKDEESVMRRKFFEDKKCFLLFNDTLSKKEGGINYNGEMRYVVETIDLLYHVGGGGASSNYYYRCGLFQTIPEKRAAMEFLEERVMDHLLPSLYPFSWLLTEELTYYDWGKPSTRMVVLAQNCIAIAFGDILTLAEKEKKAIENEVLAMILSKATAKKEEEMQFFYAVSTEDMYEVYFEDYPNTEEENMQLLMNAGFICKGTYRGEETKGKTPSKVEDCKAFIQLVLGSTDDEVEAKYGDEYPLVTEKYCLMKELLVTIGYIH